MVERISPDDENVLAESLKRAASASRPAFSESLHARICRAVERGKTRTSRPAAGARSSRRWLQAAMAAACVLIACVVAWWPSDLTGPKPDPLDVNRSVAETVDPLAPLDELTTATGRTAELGLLAVDYSLTTGRWAYLDHDAQTAARLLIDQLLLDPFETTEP